MLLLLLALVAFFLAWSNGANDNFKGVATLYGSGTAGFRAALVWATVATLLGSAVSVVLARGLVASFSGRGLVPDAMVEPPLLAATGLAAAVTVFLATLVGMPTSTTHALTGALVGTALTAAGTGAIGWQQLTTKFAQPLLLSPVLAIGVTAVAYLALRRLRMRTGVEEDSCVCVAGAPPQAAVAAAGGGALYASAESAFKVEVGDSHRCADPAGRLPGISARRAIDALHFVSGGAVCFARAVNDTPKIAALLIAGVGLRGAAVTTGELTLVALAMAAGGWLQSRRVAETMSRDITDLNPGQGLTANLVTAALVLGASRLGLPVSTTHVSCGAIFGIGLANRRGRWRTVSQILATWLTTLPLALLLAAALIGSSGGWAPRAC